MVSQPTKRGASHLLEHRPLQVGVDVSQEHVFGVADRPPAARGRNSAKTLSWVSRVWAVLMSASYRPLQRKVLPRPADEPAQVGAPRGEERQVLGRKVLAHHRHHPRGLEVARRGGEVRGRTPEHLLAPARGRLQGVERDRSHDQERHPPSLFKKRKLGGPPPFRLNRALRRRATRPRALARGALCGQRLALLNAFADCPGRPPWRAGRRPPRCRPPGSCAPPP